MIKIEELTKRLNETNYWIEYLKNWNKEHEKQYTVFTNKITNGNGRMNLWNLNHDKYQLEAMINKIVNK